MNRNFLKKKLNLIFKHEFILHGRQSKRSDFLNILTSIYSETLSLSQIQ